MSFPSGNLLGPVLEKFNSMQSFDVEKSYIVQVGGTSAEDIDSCDFCNVVVVH